MNDVSISLLLAVAATFFVAGIVKGITGMGLPTVAMAILGGLLSPVTAASLLIIPSFTTNVWQLIAGPNFVAVLRRWPMLAGVFVGTLASASVLTGGETRLSTVFLGLALTAYAIYTLSAKPYHINQTHECWLSPMIGLATGLIAGATGVFVIPAVPYVPALGFERDDLVQALGLSFTISTIALAAGLALQDAFQLDGVALSSLAVLPALIGMWAGQYVRKAVSASTFKRCFLIALALLGIEMLLRDA
ncbi:sulfite exporter TauE/SafE family protein [Rhizobium sp. IBUN]|uniref:sulfite exporter TauE/SafE family protein n=1 Tax=Rhizobium sp. IBUN TaxID=1042326 RepID=UPI000422122E|nr:sulfite exporter TauE/SafE family protein [Rhizobium sp. IBUN]